MVALADNREAMQKADRQAREQLKNFPQYWGEQGPERFTLVRL